MITGHFTTALIPYVQNKKLPLFTLLLITQIPDFFIPLDIYISGESNFRKLEMTYSHDLVPVMIMTLIVTITIHFIYRNQSLTIWTLCLMVFHEICDLVAGFAHNVMGLNSPRLGTDFYRTAPLNAYLLELILSLICIVYFLYQRKKQNDSTPLYKTLILIGIVFIPIVASIILVLIGKPII
jgi:hypothetical protein